MSFYIFNPASQYSSNPNEETEHSRSIDADNIPEAAQMYAVDFLPSDMSEVKNGDKVEMWVTRLYENGEYLDCGKVVITARVVVEYSVACISSEGSIWANGRLIQGPQ